MNKADAPPPGWYPDPKGGVRLRWWDGTDWSDRHRSRPSVDALATSVANLPSADYPNVVAAGRQMRSRSDVDPNEIISQVRLAARAELDRAADVFSSRARHVTKEFEPLISQYTNKVLSFVKRALMIALVLIVAWFVFQLVAQATFFEWLGDRIDNFNSSARGVNALSRARTR